MSPVAMCAVFSRNYAAFAAVLLESFRRHHPDVPFYLLVADGPVPGDRNGDAAIFDVTLDDIDPENPKHFLFRYDVKQAILALKPAIIQYALDQGHDTVVYLDADMLILSNLSELFETVSAHAISLTPHFGSIAIDRDRFEREHQLLLAGIYNAGFIGVTNCTEARRFLAWWLARVEQWCKLDLRHGFHYDQRWLDLAPGFFQGIYTHHGYDWNLAYWSLPDVTVSAGDDSVALRVNGTPCKLFHLSGYDIREPRKLSRYAGVPDAGQSEHIAPLLEWYVDALRRHQVERTLRIPWRWDRFSNGVRIAGCIRQMLGSLGSEALAFPDPFDADPPGSFYRWLREPAGPTGQGAERRISRLWQFLYDRHADLQAQFPMEDPAGIREFVSWTSVQGLRRFGLPEEFGLNPSGT